MWSDWRHSTDLYLGAGVCLLKQPGTEVHAIEFPPTWSWHRVLEHLVQEIPRRGGSRFALKAPLRVHLGAALAPALSVRVPGALKRPGDRQAFVRSAMSRSLQCGDDGVLLAVARMREAVIGTAVAHQLVDMVSRWADAQRLHLRSIKPLWSVATGWEGLRGELVGAMLLMEPGCATYLRPDAAELGAKTWVGDDAQHVAWPHSRRMFASDGGNDAGLVRLRFTAKPEGHQSGPSGMWTGHWSGHAQD